MLKHQQPHSSLHKSQEAGYTIIESLVAMIVVSVLMIAIAPVMAYSVAIRVQAKRMEMATQAAKTYMDALRSEVIKFGGAGFPIRIPAGVGVVLADARVPTVGETYCVDMDGGGCASSSNKDFYVQGAWLNPDPSITGGDPTLKGYRLLVRVYRADSFAPGVTLKPTKTATKQSVVGSGLGDKTMPVVEMSTEIPPPTVDSSAYQSLYDRLK